MYEIGTSVNLILGNGGIMVAVVSKILADKYYELEGSGKFPITLSEAVIDKMQAQKEDAAPKRAASRVKTAPSLGKVV